MGFKAEQFVKSVDENLFCSICHEVFDNPVSCKDGHLFCKDCVHIWLKTKTTCPLLGIGYLSKKYLVPQFTVKGIIDNLEVYCHPYGTQDKPSDVGCDWIGKLQHLTHHRKTCPFQEVQCSHEECNQTVQRRELQHHEKICDFRKVECEKCGVVILQHEKYKHIEKDCLQTMISCPNQCHCSDNETEVTVMMKRLDLEYHIKNICTKTILDCPFKDQGCSVQVERQHANKHVQDNMAVHMMLLAKQCSSLTREILSLTKQNATLTEQCAALNLRCLSLTQENEDLEENLREHEENISDQMFSTFLSCGSYEWTINDFPTLCTKHPNGSGFRSPIFWLRGHRLNFLVYPNGQTKEAEGWLSLYLEFSEEYPKSRKVINKITNVNNTATVIYRLSVKSVEPETDDVSQEATHVLKEPGSWGCSEMIKTTEALSTAYCNSTDASLTIQCTIQPDKPQ